MLFTIIIFIEAICLFFAAWYLRREREWWKYFLPFLFLTVGTEITGYVLFFVHERSNHWIFNIYLLPEMAFIFYILNRLSRPLFRPEVLLGIALACFLGLYIYESYLSDWKEYSAKANTLASITIIVTGCLFYYFLLKQEQYVVITRFAPFWIISGLFVFYLGSTGCNLFVKQLTEIYKRTGVPVRYIIMLVLNFILYACWAYAFICRYRQKILSS